MFKTKLTLTLIALLSLTGCFNKTDTLSIKRSSDATTAPKTKTGSAVVSSVDIVNDQLVINGSGFSPITKVKVTGPSGFDETFQIESNNGNTIVSNGLKNILFALSGAFNLILSDAYGAATFQLGFTLQNGAVKTVHIEDGAVTGEKLHRMGATNDQVLAYDGTKWAPKSLDGLTFKGTFDASSAADQTGGSVNNGFYFIVQTSGTNDPDGGSTGKTYAVGDWAVRNGVNWNKVVASNAVSQVNGETGNVQLGINHLTDVDTNSSAPTAGQVLKWNSGTSKWEPANDATGGAAGSVTSTTIQDGSITGTDVAAGTIANANLASDIDASKITAGTLADARLSANVSLIGQTIGTSEIENGVVTDAKLAAGISQAKINGLAASLAGKENTITAGTTAQYYRGDKSWQTLDNTAVGLSNVTNDAQLPLANRDNGALSTSTVNVPTSNAVKTYVDAQVSGVTASQWTTNGSNIHFNTGHVGLGTSSPDSTAGVGKFLEISHTVPGLILEDTDGTEFSFFTNSNKLFFAAGASNEMVLDSAGNIGIGTASPSAKLDVNGNIRATHICDETGSNCKDISTGWGPSGTVTSVTAGTGLTGGTITTSGTLAVDTGTTANKIIQLDGSARLPAVDGSQLTNVSGNATAITDGLIVDADINATANIAQSKINGLTTSLAGKVSTTTTVNGNALSGNIVLDKTDIGLSNVTNDAQLPLANRDNGALSTSTTNVPTSNAVKTYVDAQVSSVNASQWTTNGSNIHFNTGFVGLGITAPSAKLHLKEATDTTVNIILDSNKTGNGGWVSALRFRAPNSPSPVDEKNFAFSHRNGTATTPNLLVFSSRTDALAEKAPILTMEQTGRIGIGTLSPSQKLEVTGSNTYALMNGTANSGYLIQNAGVEKWRIDNMTSGSDRLRIASNAAGTEVMSLLQNGNVGVNLSNPSEKFFVQGNIGIFQNNSKTDGVVWRNPAYAKFSAGIKAVNLGAWATQGLGFFTGDVQDSTTDAVERMRITQGGNIGIGVTSPSEKLEIDGNLKISGEITGSANIWTEVINVADGWAIDDYFEIVQASPKDSGSSSLYEIYVSGTRGNWTEGHFYVVSGTHSDGSNWSEVLPRSESSYVGNSRCFTVDMRGNGNSPQFRLRAIKASASCGVSATLPLRVKVKSLGFNSGWADISGTGNDSTVSKYKSHGLVYNISTGDPDNGGNTAFHIAKDGDVGLGTTAPYGNLHIKSGAKTGGNQNYYGNFILEKTDSDWSRIRFDKNGDSLWGIASDPSDRFIISRLNPAWPGAADDTNFVIATNGNVGIGTDTPGVKLDVNGGVRGTSAYQSTSDKRFKKNIQKITSAREKIKALDGVSYVWRIDEFPEKDFEEGNDIGVIAQNVEKVFPEAVLTDEEGFKSVAYAKLVAPLIEAFKEVDVEIEKNKKLFVFMSKGIQLQVDENSRRIASLEEENELLKSENKMIKSYLCTKDPKAPFCQ